MGERLLSPQELDALFRRIDSLIEEARVLQKQISERLLSSRRADQQDRTGQPARRRNLRSKQR
jgi:hypothetical protein